MQVLLVLRGVEALYILFDATELAEFSFDRYAGGMRDAHGFGDEVDILFIGVVRAVNHNAGKAVFDTGLHEVHGVAVVEVDGDGHLGMLFDGRVDDVLEVAHVGELARALRDLENQRGLFGSASFDDALRDLHVVDVKSANGETAIVSQIKHRLSGHQWHSSQSFLSVVAEAGTYHFSLTPA